MIDINQNFTKIQKPIFQKDHRQKTSKGIDFYSENTELINFIEKYSIEKELLLSLMGIETNLELM